LRSISVSMLNLLLSQWSTLLCHPWLLRLQLIQQWC